MIFRPLSVIMNTLVLLLRFFSLNSHKTGWTALVSPLLFKLAMSRPKPINVKPQTYFIVTVSVLSVIALVTFLSLVLVVMYSTSHLMAQRRRK